MMNNKVRSLLKTFLTEKNHQFTYLGRSKLTLRKIDEITKINTYTRRASSITIKNHETADIDFSIAVLVASALFTLSASVSKSRDIKSILPPHWISIEDKPNANFVFSVLLNQLTQLSFSLLELIDKGFDNGARILLRSIMELTWQILILLFNREDLRIFVKADSFDDVRNTWRLLFGNQRFSKKLDRIEVELKVDADIRLNLRNRRLDAYKFFSESVHNGFITAMLDSMQLDFEKDTLNTNFLGGACARSLDTLRAFVQSGMYFLDMFFAIVTQYHGTDLEVLPELYWKDSLVLTECVRDCIRKRISGDL